MKLMIASKNKHKIAEIKDILSDLKLEVQNALDFPEIPDVIEDRETIEGNAIKKAVEVAKCTGLLTMADDTGLFVEALQGEPGVYSARYAGEKATYKDNCDKMLNEMKNEKNREAHFKTVIALATPAGLIGTCSGKVMGNITEIEIGAGGFGYDCIFRAFETGKTFAEMSNSEKNKISHRARALKEFIPLITSYLKIS